MVTDEGVGGMGEKRSKNDAPPGGSPPQPRTGMAIPPQFLRSSPLTSEGSCTACPPPLRRRLWGHHAGGHVQRATLHPHRRRGPLLHRPRQAHAQCVLPAGHLRSLGDEGPGLGPRTVILRAPGEGDNLLVI